MTTKTPGVAIIGAGQAGAQLALSLRDEGYDDPITLIGDEPHPPYQRPPLSKSYLLGETGRENLLLRPEALFRDRNIALHLGISVSTIDPSTGCVTLAVGTRILATDIVLATGSRARPHPLVPDPLPENAHYLRSMDDADRLARGLTSARHIVVIGGGFIGLEFAAVARRKFGCEVCVIEAAPAILGRVLSNATAGHIHRRLEAWGVAIQTNAMVAATILDEAGRISSLRLTDGSQLATDMVLIGIGGIANAELAQAPGGPQTNGISVDAFLAAAPGLYALGDSALFPDRHSEMHRVESVQNAVDQARYLARRLTGKENGPFDALNWFWSDIGDMKLQIAGRALQTDEALSYLKGDNRLVTYRMRENLVVAVETVNSPADHMLAKRLLANRAQIERGRIAEANGDLRTFMT